MTPTRLLTDYRPTYVFTFTYISRDRPISPNFFTYRRMLEKLRMVLDYSWGELIIIEHLRNSIAKIELFFSHCVPMHCYILYFIHLHSIVFNSISILFLQSCAIEYNIIYIYTFTTDKPSYKLD